MTAYGREEGFRRAMADAHRRRLRTLGVAAGTVAAFAGLTVSYAGMPRASAPGRLDVVTTPERPAPSSAPTTSAATPPARRGPVAAQPSPASTTVASTAPAPGETTTPRRPQSGPMTRAVVTYDRGSLPCTPPDTWCMTAGLQFREGPAHVWSLTARLCRNDVASPDVLRFGSSAEVDLAVLDSRGTVLWSWLADHPANDTPHEVVAGVGSACFEWTAPWYERTTAGTPLPPGSYRYVARLLATDPADVRPVETAFEP